MKNGYQLAKKMDAFCESGVELIDQPYTLPRLGCGNDEELTAIAMVVIRTLQNTVDRGRLIARQDTVPELIADETVLHAKEYFTWPIVCRIIDNAGKAKVQQGTIDQMLKKYERAAITLRDDRVNTERSVKRQVQNLARVIIWAQVMSFIEREGLLSALEYT